ncbi:hypothetical protein BDQ17DRAFT_1431494 [Cyathus striatus]|nr:hypothetical protein BDQ17DRAFT_1431494 [Cyathus striatus]
MPLPLLPELFPIIASHIPLFQTPSTILSLATVSKSLYDILVPRVLYSCIITHDEASSIDMILRLLQNPELRIYVRELYMHSGLSESVRNKTQGPFNTLEGLEKLIAQNAMPNLHSLGIYLHMDWYLDKNFEPLPSSYGQLKKPFWKDLSENCPLVRNVILNGPTDHEHQDKDSGMYLLKNLSMVSISLIRNTESDTPGGLDVLYKNVVIMSPALHTLHLSKTSGMNVILKARDIFYCRLPNLAKLSLGGDFVVDEEDIPIAMEFWANHPRLAYIDVRKVFGSCFSHNCPENLLPNLVHLAANFEDIRSLSFLIHRLISLVFYDSVNFQVPYLFLDVLGGRMLPKLRRLQIYQEGSGSKVNSRREGAVWCIMKDGSFGVVTVQHKINQKTDETYISIISRVVPNIEELALNASDLNYKLPAVVHSLGAFQKLKRYYHHGPGTTEIPDDDSFVLEEREEFQSFAEELALVCPRLELVVDTLCMFPIYLTARVRRSMDGSVREVVLRNGVAPCLGNEDEPFPIIP